MLFFAGRISLLISGDIILTDIFPLYWEKYQKRKYSPRKVISIILREYIVRNVDILPEGWTHSANADNHCVHYVFRGKELFELQYVSSAMNEVVVRTKKSVNGYALQGVQHAMLLALYQNCVGLHGVTILCGNEIIVLSAPSGTGKTTLSRLLEQYCDAMVINGDFALLSVSDEGVIFEPTPFCGSSQRCLNQRVRVDRIVFLGQSKTNNWCTLTGRQAMVQFLNNSFVPAWDSEMERIVQNNIINCISKVNVNSFSFAPTRDAAEVFFAHLNK